MCAFASIGMCLFIISLSGSLFAKPPMCFSQVVPKKECVHGFVHEFVCTSVCVCVCVCVYICVCVCVCVCVVDNMYQACSYTAGA